MTGQRVTATTKFYTGFFLALALVIAVAFYAGYRAGASGASHARAASVHRGAGATP